jgi:hypothetical protein
LDLPCLFVASVAKFDAKDLRDSAFLLVAARGLDYLLLLGSSSDCVHVGVRAIRSAGAA